MARRIATAERRTAVRAAKSKLDRDTQHLEITRLTPELKRKRLALESDPEAWIWEMCGPNSGIDKPLTRKFTSQDCDMIGSFSETLQYGGRECTLACRGGGKTSRLRECIYHGLSTGELKFELYFAANQEKANDAREFIDHVVTSSEPFAKLYPEIAEPVIKLNATPAAARTMRASGYRFDDLRKPFVNEFIRFAWSANGFWFPRVPGSPSAGVRFMSYGLEKPPRGLNKLGMRPTHVSIDDPDTEETVNNRELAQKVVDFITYSIGGLGGEGASLGIDALCTLSHRGEGVAYRLSAEDTPFVVHRHVFMQQNPDHLEMWMEYVRLRQSGKAKGDKYGREAHRYYDNNRVMMNAGSVVANPHRFDSSPLADGTPKQLSAIQAYFDDWADKGEKFCRSELNNERITIDNRLTVTVSPHRMLEVVGDLERNSVDSTTTMIVRGMDIRKTEIHYAILAMEQSSNHLIVDYGIRSHGNSETTVAQAEGLILKNLRELNAAWFDSPHIDQNGMRHSATLTLIDKGWVGTWNEEGEVKAWATQPVETFCVEAGLRHWLPAKAAPAYRSPAPSQTCIVGNHWHMNCGLGKERNCTEVIWDADYWHALVEELFMLPDEDKDRFTLFIPRDGLYVNHKALGEHITLGAEVFKEQKNAGQRSRKPRFVRDHWWDSLAMGLVAQSVEEWLRSFKPREPERPMEPASTSTRRRLNFRRRS